MRRCLHCGIDMPKPKNRSQKYWETRLYCSKACMVDPVLRTELFLSSYVVDPDTGCHLSQVSTFDKDGYPEVTIGGIHWRGHRLSYHENKGPIPHGMLIRHTCDNPKCINADHLLIGTVQDNANDMVSRGRSVNRTGELNTLAKLTEKQVIAIRADNRRQADIAEDYGVAPSNISLIKTGKRWSHLG